MCREMLNPIFEVFLILFAGGLERSYVHLICYSVDKHSIFRMRYRKCKIEVQRMRIFIICTLMSIEHCINSNNISMLVYRKYFVCCITMYIGRSSIHLL